MFVLTVHVWVKVYDDCQCKYGSECMMSVCTKSACMGHGGMMTVFVLPVHVWVRMYDDGVCTKSACLRQGV